MPWDLAKEEDESQMAPCLFSHLFTLTIYNNLMSFKYAGLIKATKIF